MASQTLILGSQSPRRKEIMEFFALPFEQISPDFEETQIPFEGDPAAYASAIAQGKALSLKKLYPDRRILTADTVVYSEGKIFLKPETFEEARSMLHELSGKRHQVFTGVSVMRGSENFIEAEESSVFFQELTDHQINEYHKNFFPLDKAGGYAIQKGGSLVVKRIEGCYYNIMGLPIQTVRRLLFKVGIDLWDYLKFL